MNKDTYNKIMSNKTIINEKQKDKKFYRKRINNLTRELLLNEQDIHVFPDVIFAFDNYIKNCISYFKIIDENDIIQQDYSNTIKETPENESVEPTIIEPIIIEQTTIEQTTMDLAIDEYVIVDVNDKNSKDDSIDDSNIIETSVDNATITNINNLMMRSVNMMNPTLDVFVSYGNTKRSTLKPTSENEGNIQ